MQRALASHAWPNGVTVRARIGLYTGEPQLSAEGYVGLDVHHASRIMSAGHGGQVLLSQTTRDLVEHNLPGGVSLQDLGAHRLKDLQHPSHLFQLVMVGLPADFPPPKTLDSHPNNLPIQPTSLIGREKEVATVQHLLRREDVRMLTLTGPGGTGKTRLGLQVAAEASERFVDGVFFVNLAPISDPALVVPTIAQTLELKETGEQPLLDLLKTSLREKQLLLLLDNFEQVVSAASQVADLLAACPKLKIVVTSRMVLYVRAEHEFAVPPLALPDPTRLPDLVALSQYDAIALFIQRAQAVKADFQVTNANAPAVAEICARLDGLPLAIELAAARSKLFSPQALLPRLDSRLKLLVGGARDLPMRQQTLRGTIAWSYDLLEEAEKILFRRLSVFVGGCTLEAAEAVCNSNGDLEIDVLDTIVRLVDKSLLRQEAEIDGEPRLLMLETIREYGLEALAVNGETEDTRYAHAQYYMALAEEAEQGLDGPKQVMWLER
ncbi:MAG TPA: AAA family ATPase, partial [Ktedonobacteraceae bacterium]|nr:AAA family ATPase [Ktedonobacteraceae bacterium]